MSHSCSYFPSQLTNHHVPPSQLSWSLKIYWSYCTPTTLQLFNPSTTEFQLLYVGMRGEPKWSGGPKFSNQIGSWGNQFGSPRNSFTSCVEETLLNRVLSKAAELNTKGVERVGLIMHDESYPLSIWPQVSQKCWKLGWLEDNGDYLFWRNMHCTAAVKCHDCKGCTYGWVPVHMVHGWWQYIESVYNTMYNYNILYKA